MGPPAVRSGLLRSHAAAPASCRIRAIAAPGPLGPRLAAGHRREGIRLEKKRDGTACREETYGQGRCAARRRWLRVRWRERIGER
jgi:hypothetical protein